MFLKLEEALESLDSLDSDERDVENTVLSPDTSELTDKDQGDENVVNADENNVNDVPWSLGASETLFASIANNDRDIILSARSDKTAITSQIQISPFWNQDKGSQAKQSKTGFMKGDIMHIR
ncbi:hypothetical protein TNCV_761801 [Trichonephila clavipes]|nr:hypothetical protein TNCV_761801 [Trichonephila clavipes]